MATQVVNHIQKIAPADKTFNDFPPVVAEALEQEGLTTSYPPAPCCSPQGRLLAECSSYVKAV